MYGGLCGFLRVGGLNLDTFSNTINCMEISWIGHSCFRLKGKFATVITDPFDSNSTGLKLPKLSADLITVSHSHSDHNNPSSIEGSPYLIQGPGEYEVKGVNVVGMATFHDDKGGAERGKNTIYNITVDDVNIAHLGDIGHDLSSEQLEEFGNVDVLLIPVGGVYTIEAHTAAKIAAELEAKVVIPMHYQVEGLKYQLEGVDKFLKEMAKESVTPVSKLVITKDKLPEESQVVVLERS